MLWSSHSEMSRRIREHDWSGSALGPLERWPQSLRTAVNLMLGARQPMWLGWGPAASFLYNDAYIDVLSPAKHPWALGRPTAEVWAEIWQQIGPLVRGVFEHGEASFVDDLRLFMNRGDFIEETWYSFSYSPIRDESGVVAGLFCPCNETSAKVIGARRLATLQALATHALVEKTSEAACARALAAMALNPDDIPFALLYLRDGSHARRVACAGALDAAWAPATIALDAPGPRAAPWPMAAALRGEPQQLDLAALLEGGEAGALPRGPAGHAVAQVLALPVQADHTVGALVLAINPTRRLDADYRTFYDLVASQLGRAIASARATEEEHHRAEALGEIDRAKTAFFSNVSHEFRTPLTLLLGPLEDLIDGAEGAQRELLLTARRNAQRLLKLVNMLLDFARLEGGRADAHFEPVELAALSADLASSFRAACERAGLQLIVDCPPMPQPVYVDRAMWEQVMLNLLSNAFKFTFEGAIGVTLRPSADGRAAELVVSDSGGGIEAHELPRLFERFHRVAGARARSIEGSGIGLALVQELVKLHGGHIEAASAPGRGSRFTVHVPFGRAHLPAAQVHAAAARARGSAQAGVYVDEALQWLGPQQAGPEPGSGFGALDVAPGEAAQVERARILIADDNADLRAYLTRLLGSRYAVRALADGEAALQAALQDPPDLVISDVMLPRLDGFGVVAALRGAARTRTLPIILLSARAGEDARVEGLASGADDYLVKPFSARELLARVAAQLATAGIRRDAAAAVRHSELLLRTALRAVNAGAWVWDPADDLVELSPDVLALFGREVGTTQPGAKWMALIHPSDRERAIAQRKAQAARGEDIDLQFKVQHPAGGLRWIHTVGSRLDDGRYSGITIDITERKRAELATAEASERLRLALQAAQLGAFELFLVSGEMQSSAQCKANFGLQPDDPLPYARLFELIHEDDRALVRDAVGCAIATRSDYDAVYRIVWPDGSPHWIRARGRAIYDEHGRAERMVGVTQNISAQKNYERELLDHRAELSRLLAQLREADRRKDEFLATLAHELRNPLAPIRQALQLLRADAGRVPLDRVHDMLERQTGHMVRLVDDLMELSRISRGAIELRRERVALGAVLRAALETARPTIDALGHELRVALPDAAIELDGDAVRLAQVFANLLNNAAKYSDAGGCIELLARHDGAQALVTVRDNGIGIAPEQLPRLFRMFGQIDPSTTRAQGGLGIGLALAQQLVQLHGGSIEAASVGLGHGSSFTVRLPLAAPATASPASPAAAPLPTAPGGQRVLVVDDNQDAADSLALLLQLDGHDVRVVYDGAAALAALDAAQPWRPAVVLLDLGMPGMDGLEVARRLRANDAAAATLLVALTGWGQHTDRERTRAAGFDHHLVKPVDARALQALLASLDPTAAP